MRSRSQSPSRFRDRTTSKIAAPGNSEIHHELAASFAAARVWGPSARFDGQRVGRAHVMEDGDVVEILR